MARIEEINVVSNVDSNKYIRGSRRIRARAMRSTRTIDRREEKL